MSKNTISVALSVPIKSGEDKIKTVEIRKPKAGELRGLKLTDVLTLDVDTINELLPRISNLSARDIHNLEIDDYTTLSSELLGFFVNAGTGAQTE
ncbi:MAG: phage tail assembly protein [Hydrogenovibrio crunogenus]|nr:phage tail assembly protein [Hydrogenovibrio crunogenus]